MPSIRETISSFSIFSKSFITSDVNATGPNSFSYVGLLDFGTGIIVDVFRDLLGLTGRLIN